MTLPFCNEHSTLWFSACQKIVQARMSSLTPNNSRPSTPNHSNVRAYYTQQGQVSTYIDTYLQRSLLGTCHLSVATTTENYLPPRGPVSVLAASTAATFYQSSIFFLNKIIQSFGILTSLKIPSSTERYNVRERWMAGHQGYWDKFHGALQKYCVNCIFCKIYWVFAMIKKIFCFRFRSE